MDTNTQLSENMGTGVFDSTTGIILVILIVLISLLILYFLFKRFKVKHDISKERRSLKEDLMIWSSLTNLVAGGKKRKKGKEELTADVRIVKLIFSSAINLIKNKCYKKMKTPWYIVVGEPLSGKSSILSNTALGCEQSRKELDLKDEECLHFFISKDTVFLDVKGKTFFDTWLGGSSAQWEVICEQIKKHHHSKPLSGIVLAIPADALIADDRELTIKKANLISLELHKLSSVLCMNLPCRIVVTKSDCILGFREFFSSLTQTQREQVVGLDLTTDTGSYSEDVFKTAWMEFISRLKKGAQTLLSSKEVTDKTFNGGNRLDVSAYIYSFPEHVNVIRQGLEIYIKTIFQRTTSFRPNIIDGVYFVSSFDQGITMSSDFATLQGKPVDEALMVDKEKSSKKSYFIKQLFVNLISDLDEISVFTKREKLIRNIPLVILYTILGVLCINYVVTATLGRTLIHDYLNPDVVYYKNLKEMFDRNNIVNSPLIEMDSDGHTLNCFNELMDGGSRSSRINYFTETKSRLISRKALPFYYFPSSYLIADFNNVASDERKTIYDQMLVNMVYAPATTIFARDLLNRQEYFSEKKADALLAYMYLSIAKRAEDEDGIVILEDCVRKILAYQHPDISPKLLSQVTEINSCDDDYAKAAATQILLDPNYTPAVNSGINLLKGQLTDVTAYPESRYQIIKKIIADGYTLSDTYDRIQSYNYGYTDKKTENDFIAEYSKLRQLIHESVIISNNLYKTAGFFLNEYASPATSQNGKESQSLTVTLARQALVNVAYNTYKDMVENDFDTFDSYVSMRDSTGTDAAEGVILPSEIVTARQDAYINLERDKKKLFELMDTINLSRVFDKAGIEKDGNVLYYQVANDILQMADTADIKNTIEHTSQFVERFNTLNTIFKNKNAALSEYKKRLAQQPQLLNLAKAVSDYLVFAEFAAKMELTKQLLALYPDSSSRTSNLAILSDYVSQNPGIDYEKLFSFESARESLGYFDIDEQFAPKAVTDFINPIAVLEAFRNIKIDDGKEKNPLSTANIAYATYLSKNKRVETVINTVGDYSDRFVNYWATFADTLKPYATDYQAFHEFALNSKSYLINTQLLDIYNFSFDLLSSVKDEAIYSKTKNTKNHALKIIDDRRKALSLNFTHVCTNVLNAWAMLPEDAVKANRYISALDKKSVRNDYTTVKNLKDAKGNIPWWTAFVNLGTTLLKSEASYQTAAGLDSFQSKLYFFPILKDAAPDTMSVRFEDMPSLNRTLKSYGLVNEKDPVKEGIDKIEMAEDEGVDNLQDPLLNNVMAGRNDVRTWATSVSRILSDIGDRKNRLKTKISIPDLKTQETLIAQSGIKLPNANFYFRYVSVVSGSVETERFSTVSEKEAHEIFNQDIEQSSLSFNFYQYSDSKDADVSYKVSGGYAAIRMYLNDRAVYSEKEHCSYVPLMLKNRMGDDCVIFFKVEFNKELLSPDEWPDSENWPSITAF